MTIQSFIHDLSWQHIPADIQQMALRCLQDLIATLIAGRATRLSGSIYRVSIAAYGGDDATLLLDGHCVSASGAALAHGMTIDAMDIHDGYRPAKGHAGVNVLPAALAMGEQVKWSGEDFLAALVVGYEIALRAAVALHQSACDYHTSGAWGALGAAAVTARALQLNSVQTQHALGIAEYHAPRSQMMRCIDHPTMLKDGSGWGSMVGVIAGQLAAGGFTGAPALLLNDKSIWNTLGQTWLMSNLYFKPYACCRWSQPAVEAAHKLVQQHKIALDAIQKIHVFTFEAATRLTIARPANTEEAQYSLPYPVAAVLVDGYSDPVQVTAPRIFDDTILGLADCVTLSIDETLEARFPEEALAHVTITTSDGHIFKSPVTGARGDPANPLSDGEIAAKFMRLASQHLTSERVEAIRNACQSCTSPGGLNLLVNLLSPPPDKTG